MTVLWNHLSSWFQHELNFYEENPQFISPESRKNEVISFVENIKGNDHLQVTVIASEFNGLSLVKQHQLVYSALKEELASEAIHALALKTETPN